MAEPQNFPVTQHANMEQHMKRYLIIARSLP